MYLCSVFPSTRLSKEKLIYFFAAHAYKLSHHKCLVCSALYCCPSPTHARDSEIVEPAAFVNCVLVVLLVCFALHTFYHLHVCANVCPPCVCACLFLPRLFWYAVRYFDSFRRSWLFLCVAQFMYLFAFLFVMPCCFCCAKNLFRRWHPFLWRRTHTHTHMNLSGTDVEAGGGNPLSHCAPFRTGCVLFLAVVHSLYIFLDWR